MIKEFIKNFKIFCEMCDGKYNEEIFPECKRFSFRISIDYLEKGESLDYLKLKIISEEGDEETIELKNVKIEKVERFSEEENNEIRYYSLNVYTNLGILSLKKDIKEDKLYVEFKSQNLSYRSSIVF